MNPTGKVEIKKSRINTDTTDITPREGFKILGIPAHDQN
jgi:hypothetical protein